MGRMVDADALKENFPLPCEEWEMKGQQTLWEAREIRETIDLMPTIEERKKGKWIGEPKDGIEAMFFKPKCSVCGFESADGKNYCPNCGARMEEADETDS